jgi:hypothetical protein
MLQFILASTFFLAFSAELFAQSAAVIEAAKKEGGKVVAYGSLESEAFDAVKAGFEKKTGLQLDYWRASGTKTMERAVSEYGAGNRSMMRFCSMRMWQGWWQRKGYWQNTTRLPQRSFPKKQSIPSSARAIAM